MLRTLALAIVGALLPPMAPALAQASCGDNALAVQVLGSGGPMGVGRASAGYIVWIGGKSRIMVDAGGGTFLRFHEAEANIDDLELLALSHLHPDHASEVPALMWVQTAKLRFSGPSGSDGFPSLSEYLTGLLGPQGLFRVVAGGGEQEAVTIDVSKTEPSEVYSSGSLRVRGIGVPHGPVPAVGYRIDVGGKSIAFSSDQNGSNPAFTEFVTGVDVLIVHLAVPEQVGGFGARLHAKPSVWGQMATDAKVGTLVLSHLSAIGPLPPGGSLDGNARLKDSLGHLRSTYQGPLIVAEDLMCIPVE